MAGNWFKGGFGLAISDKMVVAMVNRSERCVQIYGVDDAAGITSWVNRRLTRELVTPYDVAFAPNNYLVVTDPGDSRVKVYDLKNELRFVREIAIQSPQNVVIGPGPLSQMFVVCGNGLTFLINMDWNAVKLKSKHVIFSAIHWNSVQFASRITCDNLSIVEDHKDSHRVGGRNPLALNTAQFCAMFYHVAQCKKMKYNCLETSRCRVGREGNKDAFSPTVVVYVRIVDERGCLIFQARYGNCYQGPTDNTIHAEYFMLMDTEFRDAVDVLRNERGGYIELYMNKQPCYFSTGKPGQCAQDLVTFYNNQCAPHGIKLAINLCQLYKADMHPFCCRRKLANEIRNAKQGMKMMMTAGIALKAMNGETWQRLADYAVLNLPEYQASSREALDQHISEFIEDLKRRDCKQCSSPNNAFNFSVQNSLKPELNQPELNDPSASKICGDEDQKVVNSVESVVETALAGSNDYTLVSDEHFAFINAQHSDVEEATVRRVSKDRNRDLEVQQGSRRTEWKQPPAKSGSSLAYATSSSAGFKYKMAPNWQLRSKVSLVTPHPSTSRRSEGESRVESSLEKKVATVNVKPERTVLTTQDQAKTGEITTEKATSQAATIMDKSC